MKSKILFASLIVCTWILSACQSVSTPPPPTATLVSPTNTPMPTNTPIPSITPSPLPLFTFRVLSYNILYGGGFDPQYEDDLSDKEYPGNKLGRKRFDAIIKIIKDQQPDIVGIEEAASWETGNPPVYEQVAKDLGFKYYVLAKSTNSPLHIAILSRFKILHSENLSYIGSNALARADIKLPNEDIVHVFVVHLNPFDQADRGRELEELGVAMRPYLQGKIIVMGDMNDEPDFVGKYFHPLNIELAASRALTYGGTIDHIWISTRLDWVTHIVGQNKTVSDHYPVGLDVDIYPSLK